MANVLIGKPRAVDRLFRADSMKDFDGEGVNLAWNSRRQGLVLVPPVVGPGARSKAIRGSYTSRPIETEIPFHELLPAWNMELDEQRQGYRVQVRVADAAQKWTPWLHFGSAGTMVQRGGRKTTQGRWGKVYIDYLLLNRPAAWFQFKVELESTREALAAPSERATLRRFFVSYSNTDEDDDLYQRFHPNGAPKPAKRSIKIPMPYRSQREVETKRLRNQICCPTCVAMILESHGISKPTLQVASEALCCETKTYGVWPRASQVAANNGLEAWIDRFRSHAQVKSVLASGQPIMASIRVNKGDWAHKQYRTSKGHLILLRGMRTNGDYIVNDPYAYGEAGAEIDYSEQDIENVWLEKGGVGIIIRKPEK